MRVSEETLNRGWVGMGWWVNGLSVGASKYEKTIFLILSFHAILRCRLLHVFCVPALLVSTRKKCVQTTPPTNIYVSRYVYSIIFVFLRLCSSHQLIYTSNLKTTITTTKWVQVFVINLSTTMQQHTSKYMIIRYDSLS